jgi:hypothetical protein
MSNGSTPPTLNSCGCCAPGVSLNTESNRPGLNALSYRLGTYGIFLQRLLDEIHSATIPDGPNQGARPLATLTTRAPDDPSIALLDAWAVVADVLTFYQERIVNEGFLRTATERRSVLELARAIGYELRPGVAASAYLQFTVEEIIGAAIPPSSIPGLRLPTAPGPGNTAFNQGVVSIPEGAQIQSVPAPGQLPQTFETSADFEAHVEWNRLTPRLVRPADLALSGGNLYLLGTRTSFAPGTFVWLPAALVFPINPLTTIGPSVALIAAVQIGEFYLQGTSTNLNRGDKLLLVGSRSNLVATQTFIVREVEVQATLNQTRIALMDNASLPTFAPATFTPLTLTTQKIPFTQDNVNTNILQKSISESDLDAFLQMNGWNASDLETAVNTPLVPPFSQTGAYAFRATAAFFGNNAAPWKSLPDPTKSQRSDPYPLDWDAANSGQGRYIWTDSQGKPYPDADVYLERAFPQILANSWALFECPTLGGVVFQILSRQERSLADYGLSGRASGLTLQLQGGSIGEGLSSPSAVSWAANRLDSFAVGFDGNLYHRWWDGAHWGPGVGVSPEHLGGGNLINSPSAVSWAANRLDVFAIGSNGNLYHKAGDGSNWLPDPNLEDLGGGNLINSPSGVSWAANRLDIFAIGSDGNLYHKYWDGSNWGPGGGLENLGGGNLINSPSVVSWAANRLDIFAIGSDGNLYHKYWDGSNWGPGGGLEALGGGNLVSSPSADSWAPGRLDIFAFGSDGLLYHKWWDGSWGPFGVVFGPLEILGGGNFVKSPSVVSWAPNRLDVFALGWDGNLYHLGWDGSNWGGPENLGGNGNLTSSPSATAWAAHRLDIFVLGASGHWLHKSWDGSNWGGPEDLGNGSLAAFPVRTTTAYVQSEQFTLADFPIEDVIPANASEFMLNDMVIGLAPGQSVSLTGIRADASGVSNSEILTLRDIEHDGGVTTLKFVAGLQFSYVRSTVAINANVTLGTHGATVQEVLGNGDASQANQSFVLKRPPLTYVSAPTPSGVESTLLVRVNDLEWTESPTLFGLGPSDENYIVRLADDATPTVTFGDPAERLRTGQQNVKATYRTGIGVAGNVGAGSLSILQSRPPGLRAVTNPLSSSGGADPQDLSHARVNAPLTVLTLDRIVSLDDYENFTQAFAGIGKAQAVALWSGEMRLLAITAAMANGDPLAQSAPLYQSLVQAINLAHDPVGQFLVLGYQSLVFNLTAAVLIDSPRYESTLVLAQVASRLSTAFSFENRSFAQAVTAAEIVTLIQSVPGVIATDLTQLYLTTDPTGPSQTEPPPFLAAAPARWEDGAIQPAQLLLLNPLGAALTEMTA